MDQRDWTDESDLPEMRTDLTIGYAVGGLTTVAILIAAAPLRPMGYT